MRRWYLAIPAAAIAMWFACGKLSTKRTDTDKTSTEKTATDTTTDTANAASECLEIQAVEDQETADRVTELQCAEKALACETDADCVYGGAGGCSGPSPLHTRYAALIKALHDFRGRNADCAVAHSLPAEKVTPLCQDKQCVGKASYQKKDGSPADCVFGKGTACRETFLCSSVYFGEEIVDIREYAVDDSLCTLSGKTEGTYCFQVPGGNTNPPQPPTYQRTSPEAACQIFTNAAAK